MAPNIETQSPSSAMDEIEALAPVLALLERYGRLTTTHELAGQRAAAAACELIACQLADTVEAIRELHTLEAERFAPAVS